MQAQGRASSAETLRKYSWSAPRTISWRVAPFLIAAMQSLSRSSCVIEITMRRGLSALSGRRGSEGKGGGSARRGRSSLGVSARRGGAMTGATTDGVASPLRASRLAERAWNFVAVTGGSPDLMRRRRGRRRAVRRAAAPGGRRSRSRAMFRRKRLFGRGRSGARDRCKAPHPRRPFGPGSNGARGRYKVPVSAPGAERASPSV